MKIRYLDLNEEIVFEKDNISIAPSMGDLVWFDEAFYIEHIVWYPNEDMIQVYLTDEKPSKKKNIAESTTNNVKSDRMVINAQESADKALKETSKLRREVFSIRQHLKTKGQKDKS